MVKSLLNIRVTWDEVYSTGEALVHWVPADHYGENKAYKHCGAGWLFSPTLENLKKK